MVEQAVLTGVRVLSLEQVHVLPWGTAFLADFGAQVIRVESADHMNDRRSGPFPTGNPAKHGGTRGNLRLLGSEQGEPLSGCDPAPRQGGVPEVGGTERYRHRQLPPRHHAAPRPGPRQFGPHQARHHHAELHRLRPYRAVARLWGASAHGGCRLWSVFFDRAMKGAKLSAPAATTWIIPAGSMSPTPCCWRCTVAARQGKAHASISACMRPGSPVSHQRSWRYNGITRPRLGTAHVEGAAQRLSLPG